MKCPPLRLPPETSFCPDCLYLMPTEQWAATRYDFPCPHCGERISLYSTSASKYLLRRKKRYGKA